MGKKKKSGARAAERKSARQAFGRSSGPNNTAGMCPVVRGNLEQAIQGPGRKEVVERAGMPFNVLARIATGAQPPKPEQAQAITRLASEMGWNAQSPK